MFNTIFLGLDATLAFSIGAIEGQTSSEAGEIRNIGSRLELFVDDWLIEQMNGVELRLHHPTPGEVVIVFDKPWEGNTSAYVTVFQDDDLFRMYYRGSHHDFETKKVGHQVACYAESQDGIHWTKPELNVVEFEGSTCNNIVWDGVGDHNFTPFKDTNPDCKPEARYKALGTGEGGLVAFQSPDGIHWSLMQEEAVITKGAFDSQNLAFWDSVRGRYVDFHRGSRDGVRAIMTCASEDFIHWTEPDWIDFGDAPPEHLYTNAITPYFRAPHIFLGFPKRFLPSRKSNFHPNPGISDGVFMSSRDGVHWKRWLEAFIRPGLQKERWVNRNNMTAWGILQTQAEIPGLPHELSLYSSENYYAVDGTCRLRRFTLRQDGFISVHAPYAGGEFVTHPLMFEGKELVINYSTSGAGGVQVEITDQNGNAIPNFTLNDCPEIYGDEIEKVVEWNSQSDLSSLTGQTIRLRFVLKDADLYSIRFRP